MKIERLLINICSEKLTESRNFYTTLFDFNVDYDSDWFIHLISKDKKFELGIINHSSEIVPETIQSSPQGIYLTIVVESVDEIFEFAKREGLEILKEPENTFYGQRRLLLKDPNGTLIDVSSPIKDFDFKK